MSSQLECTIGSYNILNPFHAVKWAASQGITDDAALLSPRDLRESTRSLAWIRYSNWEERKGALADNIELASIVCLQEVATDTLQDIAEINRHYRTALHACHQHSTSFNKHGTAIVYNPNFAELIEAHDIKYTGVNGRFRCAVSADFRIEDKIIRVVSVHLDGYNPQEENIETKIASQKPGFDELATYVADAETNTECLDGIVIAGDFNEDPSEATSKYYRVGHLENLGYFRDGNDCATEPDTGRRIDWIYYKPLKTNKESTTLTSMNLEESQKPTSDHLMTGTEIQWNYTDS